MRCALPAPLSFRSARRRTAARCCGCRCYTVLVLPLRAPRSARNTGRSGSAEGSPLLRQHARNCARPSSANSAPLRGGDAGRTGISVFAAYIRQTLEALRDAGVRRLMVLPLFPQSSGSTTGAVYDQVVAALRNWRALPELRYIAGYHADPRLHQRARRQRQRSLAAARARRPSADVVSRHPPVIRAPAAIATRDECRRPRRCSRRRSTWRRATGACLSIALRRHSLAHPGHRSDAAGTAAARGARGHGDLPRVRRRLPGDAGGDRARTAAMPF